MAHSDVVDRDRIWDTVLQMVQHRQSFTSREVRERAGLEDSKARTVRRLLNQMEELEWLTRDKPGGHYWKPGPKVEQLATLGDTWSTE